MSMLTFPDAVVSGGEPGPKVEESSSPSAAATPGAEVPAESTRAGACDLVACWRKIEEGSKKAHTYTCEWLPIDPQPRRTEQQSREIHALRAVRATPQGEWPERLLTQFNKPTSAELSDEEADRLIEMLRDAIKKCGRKSETEARRRERQQTRAADANVPPEM